MLFFLRPLGLYEIDQAFAKFAEFQGEIFPGGVLKAILQTEKYLQHINLHIHIGITQFGRYKSKVVIAQGLSMNYVITFWS